MGDARVSRRDIIVCACAVSLAVTLAMAAGLVLGTRLETVGVPDSMVVVVGAVLAACSMLMLLKVASILSRAERQADPISGDRIPITPELKARAMAVQQENEK